MSHPSSDADDDEPCRHLVNEDGSSFSTDVAEFRRVLGILDNGGRESFRDTNASAIASNDARRMLVVAGPGAGKSFLFMERIKYWLPIQPESEVCVSSFVRKLVVDLRSDVEKRIEEDDQERITVNTLHGLALGILNRSRGTFDQTLQPPIQVITDSWHAMVWQDVLGFHPDLSSRTYTYKAFENQLHNDDLDSASDWTDIRSTYFTLGRFYNAVGFADLILLTRDAVEEQPLLNRHSLWIIDEFQDFNPAEDHLIKTLTGTASGVLIAGDDEQALYQELKASTPEIIISYYNDPDVVNAMLPYCSRCSYHVCLAASDFISQSQEAGAIEKVYLPLKVEESAPRVQVVGTNTPSGAVDYIQKFLSDRKDELEAYTAKMGAGETTDPFLLILTPSKQLTFLKTHDADVALRTFLSQWTTVSSGRSADYHMVATFQLVGIDPSDNFSLRKVLEYRKVPATVVHRLLVDALDHDSSLAEVSDEIVEEALTVCRSVMESIDSEDMSPSEVVDSLAELVAIGNKDRLAQELTDHPLAEGGFDADAESSEAIETAGAMAPVELLSIVGSKGLSAQHVIIIGCDDVYLGKTSRLAFFVGLTRARQSLHLITSLKARGSKTAHPFVLSLPEQHCEYVIYKKTGHVSERQSDKAGFVGKLRQWARAAERSANR